MRKMILYIIHILYCSLLYASYLYITFFLLSDSSSPPVAAARTSGRLDVSQTAWAGQPAPAKEVTEYPPALRVGKLKPQTLFPNQEEKEVVIVPKVTG